MRAGHRVVFAQVSAHARGDRFLTGVEVHFTRNHPGGDVEGGKFPFLIDNAEEVLDGPNLGHRFIQIHCGFFAYSHYFLSFCALTSSNCIGEVRLIYKFPGNWPEKREQHSYPGRHETAGQRLPLIFGL